MLKEYYHVTSIGNKKSILKNGWIVTSLSPHGAFYGRGIYFWENILDAINIGEYWYGKNKYEIISQNIYVSRWKKIDKDDPLLPCPDETSRFFLSKNIRILMIDEAYFSHRRNIIAKGGILSWLVDLQGNEKVSISVEDLETEVI